MSHFLFHKIFNFFLRWEKTLTNFYLNKKRERREIHMQWEWRSSCWRIFLHSWLLVHLLTFFSMLSSRSVDEKGEIFPSLSISCKLFNAFKVVLTWSESEQDEEGKSQQRTCPKRFLVIEKWDFQLRGSNYIYHYEQQLL